MVQEEPPYDCLHVAGFEMFGCARAIRNSMNVPIPLVLDEHNIEFRLQQSLGGIQDGFPTSLQYRAFNALQTREIKEKRAGGLA